MEHYLKHKFRGKNPGLIAAMIIFGILAVTGLAILFGFIILWLWNWLMPDLFGLPEITYWQGVGIFILAKIIFGFGGGGGGSSKHEKEADWDYDCEGNPKKKKGSNWSRWKHYDKFWKEEGEAAFQEYLNKKNGNDSAIAQAEEE